MPAPSRSARRRGGPYAFLSERAGASPAPTLVIGTGGGKPRPYIQFFTSVGTTPPRSPLALSDFGIEKSKIEQVPGDDERETKRVSRARRPAARCCLL